MWWRCPHGRRIVAPAEWIRYLRCGHSYTNAVGVGVGHRSGPAWAEDAVVPADVS